MIALALVLGCALAPAPPAPEVDCAGYVTPEIWPPGDASVRDPVVVRFADQVEGDGKWPLPGGLPKVVVSADGAPVEGSVRQITGAGWSARDLVFVPRGPLPPSVEVRVDVSGTCGTLRSSFRTTAAGGSVELPRRSTYRVDGSSAWPAPRMAKAFPSWIRVAVDEGERAVLAGDDCFGTELASAGDGAMIDLAAEAFPAVDLVEGAVVRNLRIGGVFRPDGSAIDGLRLRGELDVRANPMGCPALEALGFPCDACSDGGGPSCVILDLPGARATRVGEGIPEACREGQTP